MYLSVGLVLLLTVVNCSLVLSEPALIAISPLVAQFKPLASKMILTCTINIDELSANKVQIIRWIGPDKQVIGDTKGREFVEQLDERRLRLYITRIDNTDSGTYWCEAVVNNTTLSAQTKLHLYDDIKFNEAMTNITFEAGSSALIPCIATGQPEPEMSWRFKNKKIIIDGLKYRQESRGLRIDYVQPDDSGVYECRAEVVNQGNLKVQTLQLDVLYAPVLTSPLVVPLAVQGADVSLRCQGRGNPPVTFQWFKELKKSVDEAAERELLKPVSATDPGTLHFTQLDFTKDDGKYVCVLSNSLGTFETAADVNVAVAPVVTLVQQTVNVVEGNSVEIPCEATGRPLPHVFWTTNNNQTMTIGKQSVDNKELGTSLIVINNITQHDSGMYTCVAVNDAGSSTQNITVVVEFGPSVVHLSDDTKLGWANETIVFTCTVSGLPITTVSWSRDTDDYYITTDNIYSVTATTLGTDTVTTTLEVKVPNHHVPVIYGSYTCRAKNIHGASNATFQLVEALVPDMPRNLTVVHTTSTTLHLSVSRPSPQQVVAMDTDQLVTIETSRLDVTSWIVTLHSDIHNKEIAKTFADGDDIVITNLTPLTMYIVSVAALNPVGTGTVAKIRITTAPKSPGDDELMQADDSRVVLSQQGAAAAWSIDETRQLNAAGELLPSNWSQLSIVLIVGIAIVLATVVVAVSALILHTQRHLVASAGKQRTRREPTAALQMTSVKVSDGRDVDSLTLEIKGRRPASPPANIPDELYRSLGRNAGKNVMTEYGSAVPSPRLGARPSGSAAASPAPGGRSTVNTPVLGGRTATADGPVVTAVEVSVAQRTAWNQMLEEVDREPTVDGTGAEQAADNVLPQQTTEEQPEDDSDTDSIISEDEFDQQTQPFEGKSFLSYP